MSKKRRKKSIQGIRYTPQTLGIAAVVVALLLVILIARAVGGGGKKKSNDTTPPVIQLVTNPDSYTVPHHAYNEEGYTATDDVDGDITDRVRSYQGDGKVYYFVEDSAGNQATATRTLTYDDRTAPTITLEGGDNVTITATKSAYEDPGYTAIDDGDGDVTDKVVVSGFVNPYALGVYTLTYTVTDSFGNTATATRLVTVQDDGTGTVPQSIGRIIYLTFDDGPSEYTSELLDILDKYGVKATFFTINSDYADLIADEAARGHTLAVHSATHDYAKIYSSVDDYIADFEEQRQVIYDKCGIWTNLFRFPGGSSNTISKKYCTGIMTELTKTMEEKGYYYFDWNVTSGDAGDTTSTETVYNNIVSGIQEETASGKDSVILQHDTKKFSIDAVERVIQWGMENGYGFAALNENSPVTHHGVNN